MKPLVRPLMFLIALTLIIPLSLPAAPSVQAQDGGPVRNGDAVTFSLSGAAAVPEQGSVISIQDPNQELITGDDNMKRIGSTSGNPWRATAKLYVTFPSGTVECTGFFVSPTAVVSNGHCLYDWDSGENAFAATIVPGLNGTSFPFGSANAVAAFAPNDWYDFGDPNWDISVFYLGDPTPGLAVGSFMQFAVLNPYMLFDGVFGKLTVNGYPLDKAHNGVFGTTQWKDQDYPTGWSSQLLYYPIDTANQYGSPVWAKYKGKQYVVAIHSGEGFDECDGWYQNCGVFVTSGVADWLDLYAAPTLPTATMLVPPLTPLAPLSIYYTNQKQQTFSWEESVLGTYTQYEFELWEEKSTTDANGNQTHTWKRKVRKVTSNTFINATLSTSEAWYEWFVRGIQANGLPGPWAGGNWVYLDVTKPPAPKLVLPVNKSTISEYPQTLAWEPTNDDWDYFEIQGKRAGESWANADVAFTDDWVILGYVSNGDVVQWRVRTIDEFGNVGKWSKVFTFTVSGVLSLATDQADLLGGSDVRPARSTPSIAPPTTHARDVGNTDSTPTPRGGAPIITLDEGSTPAAPNEGSAPVTTNEDGIPVISID